MGLKDDLETESAELFKRKWEERQGAVVPEEVDSISAEAFSGVKPGASRQDVVARLGQPTFGSTISGDEGTRESLTYNLENGDEVVVRLVNGIVVQGGSR